MSIPRSLSWQHSPSLKTDHFWNFAFLSRQGIKCGGSDDNNDEDDHDHEDKDVDEDENNDNGKNHDDNDDHSNNNCILKTNIPGSYTS